MIALLAAHVQMESRECVNVLRDIFHFPQLLPIVIISNVMEFIGIRQEFAPPTEHAVHQMTVHAIQVTLGPTANLQLVTVLYLQVDLFVHLTENVLL